MSERLDFLKFIENEKQNTEGKKQDSKFIEEHKSQDSFKKFSRSKLAGLLAGVVATVGIGKINMDRLDSYNFEKYKKDKNSLEQVEPAEENLVEPAEENLRELQRELESMKLVRNILFTESLYTYYQFRGETEEKSFVEKDRMFSEEEKTFCELVAEEERRQQYANARSENLDVLERAYANGLKNLDYLFQVAEQVGVPRGILLGIVLEESNFKKDAVNKRSSAKSEMQILDGTAKKWSIDFSKEIKKWIQEMETSGTYNDPEYKAKYQKLKELQAKLKRGEDLRKDDGLYLGAFGLWRLMRNREDEALAVLAYKKGNNGVSEEVKKAKSSGGKGTFIEIMPNLKGDDKLYVIRVQAELNLFLKVLDHIIKRMETQIETQINEQNKQNIYYDPKEN